MTAGPGDTGAVSTGDTGAVSTGAVGEANAQRSELWVVILIGLTAILTAWTGYQSTKWSGEQSTRYSASGAARTESIRATSIADQQRSIDVATFIAWIEAIADDDSERADFIGNRFTARLTPAFEAWLSTEPRTNPEAPATPFELPEYVLSAADEAEALSAVAAAESRAAAEASSRVDRYVVMTVVFALVLFFGALSSKLRSPRNRTIVLGIATAGLVIGAAVLATFPVRF